MKPGQSGVVYFTNTPNELNHALYSTRIDLHLDPQHRLRPGSWVGAPEAPGGANDTYVFDIYSRSARTAGLKSTTRSPEASFTSSYQVSEVNSTIMVSRCAIFIISAPMGPTCPGGVQMVKMPYLLTTVVDFTSEKCLVVASMFIYDDGTSFRNEIDNGGQ